MHCMVFLPIFLDVIKIDVYFNTFFPPKSRPFASRMLSFDLDLRGFKYRVNTHLFVISGCLALGGVKPNIITIVII